MSAPADIHQENKRKVNVRMCVGAGRAKDCFFCLIFKETMKMRCVLSRIVGVELIRRVTCHLGMSGSVNTPQPFVFRCRSEERRLESSVHIIPFS